MKKIILLLVLIVGLLLPQVLSFGAVRSVSGSNVALTIDVSSTTGYIIEESIPDTVIVSNIDNSGNYLTAKKIIRWTKTDNTVTALSYHTSGIGTITGLMYGGSPSSQETITGEASVPKEATCTPSCTEKTCGDNGCGGSCGSCQAGETCTDSQCVPPGPDLTVTAGDDETKNILVIINTKLTLLKSGNQSPSTLQKISAIASALKEFFAN